MLVTEGQARLINGDKIELDKVIFIISIITK